MLNIANVSNGIQGGLLCGEEEEEEEEENEKNAWRGGVSQPLR